MQIFRWDIKGKYPDFADLQTFANYLNFGSCSRPSICRNVTQSTSEGAFALGLLLKTAIAHNY